MSKYGILCTQGTRRKPRLLLNEILLSAQGRHMPHVFMRQYQPCEILLLYGWGGELQQKAIDQHKGRYVALDLGYWDRAGLTERHWRVSIDGFHCPQFIMQGDLPHGGRLRRADFTIGNNRITDGHILLIGNTPKSQRAGANGWSQRKAEEIRNYFPDKKIRYRPKPGRPIEGRVDHNGLAMGDLTKELKTCSLVVTRHSNVAIDACRLGVPVVCDDGAAAAIYPSHLADYENQPSLETRCEFLQRLAWWQWSVRDIRDGLFWPWLESKLAED